MAAAGTITLVSPAPTFSGPSPASRYRVYDFTWLSDASGDVKETALVVDPGAFVQVEVYPDAGGTQPTDAFDVTLLNELGADLITGEGSNLSNAGPTLVKSAGYAHPGGSLYPTIANAGDSKGGRIRLIFS